MTRRGGSGWGHPAAAVVVVRWWARVVRAGGGATTSGMWGRAPGASDSVWRCSPAVARTSWVLVENGSFSRALMARAGRDRRAEGRAWDRVELAAGECAAAAGALSELTASEPARCERARGGCDSAWSRACSSALRSLVVRAGLGSGARSAATARAVAPRRSSRRGGTAEARPCALASMLRETLALTARGTAVRPRPALPTCSVPTQFRCVPGS